MIIWHYYIRWAVALLVILGYSWTKADDFYGGVHLTVPLTFDSAGVQVVTRYRAVEGRAGIDYRGYSQAGVGLAGGDEDGYMFSAGVAYSSFHSGTTIYSALTHGGRTEVGAVTYGLAPEVTYAFVGRKVAWDNDDNQTVTRASNDIVTTPNNPNPGNSSGGNTGEDETGPDDGYDTGGGDSGDNDAINNENRSGLGDGTNPGKGKGRYRSPNKGTNNPHKDAK